MGIVSNQVSQSGVFLCCGELASSATTKENGFLFFGVFYS